MQKKDPNIIEPDPPKAPDAAVNAVEADPGAVSEQLEQSYEEENTQEEEPLEDSDQEDQDEEEDLHFIEIELQDDEGNPVPGEYYRVRLPDGRTLTGYLDEEGKARIENLTQTGNCDVSFPRIHEEEWEE